MASTNSRRLLRALLLAGMSGGIAVAAFSQAGRQDSLKAAVAAQRAGVASADSAGDRAAAVEARVRLAGMVKDPEAMRLLERAAALADSMDRPDLGTTALRLLSARQAAAGNFRAAYSGALHADSLQQASDRRDADRWEASRAEELQRMAAARDSLLSLAAGREQRMARAIVDLQQRSDGWMYGAVAALVVGLALLAALLVFFGRKDRRARTSIENLRQEVEGLKRQAGSAAPPKPQVPPADAAMAPVVAGMFRRDGPERLATLRDARQRGDTAKVLRVVATLKPQLLAFDAERFGPLISRLRPVNAPTDARQWSADLDELEKGVEEWARHSGES